MALSEGAEVFVATFEDVSLHGVGDVSEEAWAAPCGGVVVFGAGGAVFPDDSAVLPHGPAAPDAVEGGELVWGEGSAGDGALGAAGAVEGEPVGGAADDGFLLGVALRRRERRPSLFSR